MSRVTATDAALTLTLDVCCVHTQPAVALGGPPEPEPAPSSATAPAAWKPSFPSNGPCWIRAYWSRSASKGAGTAQVFPVVSRMDLVARMPRPNFPSMVRASPFQPCSTHLDSRGTVATGPLADGTVTGPRSTSWSPDVRT